MNHHPLGLEVSYRVKRYELRLRRLYFKRHNDLYYYCPISRWLYLSWDEAHFLFAKMTSLNSLDVIRDRLKEFRLRELTLALDKSCQISYIGINFFIHEKAYNMPYIERNNDYSQNTIWIESTISNRQQRQRHLLTSLRYKVIKLLLKHHPLGLEDFLASIVWNWNFADWVLRFNDLYYWPQRMSLSMKVIVISYIKR